MHKTNFVDTFFSQKLLVNLANIYKETANYVELNIIFFIEKLNFLYMFYLNALLQIFLTVLE